MKKQINMKKYSAEFKKFVIIDMITNKLGYNEIQRKYEIKGNHTVQDWEKIYLKEGESGLMATCNNKPQNKNTKAKKKTTKQQDVVELTNVNGEIETKDEKIQRLEMEVAYLKKLRALIQSGEEID